MKHVLAAVVVVAMAINPVAVDAAPAGSSGNTYDVRVDVLEYGKGSYSQQLGTMTSQTAQLLVYSRDDGTTAVQLKIPAPAFDENNPDFAVSAYSIYRETFPAEASYVFGALDLITIPFPLRLNHAQDDAPAVVDLTGPDGQPVGDSYQFADASGEPLQNVDLDFSSLNIMSGDVTTGTASLDAEGKLVIPDPRFSLDNSYAKPQLTVTLTEPESGTRLVLESHTLQRSDREPGTSVTVPFLNDWATPPDNVDVYAGQIFDGDDLPATGIKFNVYAHAYGGSSSESYISEVSAGPEGRFRLAFERRQQSEDSPLLPFKVEPIIALRFEGSAQLRELDPGRNIEVRNAHEATVALEFLDENGQPVDFASTPALARLLPSHQLEGFISSKPDGSSRPPRVIRQIEIKDGKVQPVQLTVPNTYQVTMPGYAFRETKLDVGETTLTFRPLFADFQLSGRVTDLKGAPVPGAFVVASDPMLFFSTLAFGAQDIAKVFGDSITSGTANSGEGGLYVAKTESDGTFTISGNSLSIMTRLMVVADNFGQLVLAPLPKQIEAVAPELKSGGVEGLQNLRMTGSYDYGTISIAREATATLTLKEDKQQETTSSFEMLTATVSAEFLGTGEKPVEMLWGNIGANNEWIPTQIADGDTLSISVPAETTATITLVSDRSGEDLQYHVEIRDPLKPGEVRDLGVIEQKDGKPWGEDPE